jgi:NAD(P)-dependent dehydrogenase (short-subunit alcohol dehydrogenase family)
MTSRMADLFSVEGKVVVVTGGSRGIGEMMARGFLEAGASVYITARKAEACEETAVKLSAFGDCRALPADISTSDGVERVRAHVAAEREQVDVLVNNAGATWGDSLESYPRAAFDKLLMTNVVGPFELTVALLPLLRAAASAEDPARVINIGSVEGSTAFGNDNFAYPASKAAIHMLTRHLAQTLAPDNITVNAIAPGSFHTKMVAFLLDDPEKKKAMAASIPLGRTGSADDAAGLSVFLASRAANYITGAVIPLDGGLTAR